MIRLDTFENIDLITKRLEHVYAQIALTMARRPFCDATVAGRGELTNIEGFDVR